MLISQELLSIELHVLISEIICTVLVCVSQYVELVLYRTAGTFDGELHLEVWQSELRLPN